MRRRLYFNVYWVLKSKINRLFYRPKFKNGSIVCLTHFPDVYGVLHSSKYSEIFDEKMCEVSVAKELKLTICEAHLKLKKDLDKLEEVMLRLTLEE